MSKELNLTPDYIMREMAKLAMEQITSLFAETAEKTAKDMRSGCLPMASGPGALEAFARAIRKKNAELYPTEGKPS